MTYQVACVECGEVIEIDHRCYRRSAVPSSWSSDWAYPSMAVYDQDFYVRGRFTPDFETASELMDYLAQQGQTAVKHDHLWADWPWPQGIGDPHSGQSVLFVCEVPECLAVTTLPKAVEADARADAESRR